MRNLTTSLTLVCITALSAQDTQVKEGTAPDLTKSTDQLRAAVTKMVGLAGGSFHSTEAQDVAMMRRFRNMVPAGNEIEVNGEWSGPLRTAELNDGDDKVVLHGGRTLAWRSGKWYCRQGTLAAGNRMPFVLDPQQLFRTLVGMDKELKVSHTELTKSGDQEQQILSCTFEGEQATDLFLSGLLPSLGSPMMMMMGGPAGMPPPEMPEVTLDLAFTVDAEGLVQRLRIKAYKTESMPANMQIQINGANSDEEVDEPTVEDKDAAGNRIYKKGMPVRGVDKQTSVVDLEVRFKNHGKSTQPELDTRQRDWLMLPAK